MLDASPKCGLSSVVSDKKGVTRHVDCSRPNPTNAGRTQLPNRLIDSSNAKTASTNAQRVSAVADAVEEFFSPHEWNSAKSYSGGAAASNRSLQLGIKATARNRASRTTTRPAQAKEPDSRDRPPRGLVMGTGMQLVEIRLAVLPSPDRFPVHEDAADPKQPQRIDYPRILGGPIVASARVEPDPIALTSGHQSVAVVLDSWTHADPLGAFWQGLGRQRDFAPGTNIRVNRPPPGGWARTTLRLPAWRLPEPAPSGCPIAMAHRDGDSGTRAGRHGRDQGDGQGDRRWHRSF
jgi:hypothetical protein